MRQRLLPLVMVVLSWSAMAEPTGDYVQRVCGAHPLAGTGRSCSGKSERTGITRLCEQWAACERTVSRVLREVGKDEEAERQKRAEILRLGSADCQTILLQKADEERRSSERGCQLLCPAGGASSMKWPLQGFNRGAT
jgi:hypothetical protein